MAYKDQVSAIFLTSNITNFLFLPCCCYGANNCFIYLFLVHASNCLANEMLTFCKRNNVYILYFFNTTDILIEIKLLIYSRRKYYCYYRNTKLLWGHLIIHFSNIAIAIFIRILEVAIIFLATEYIVLFSYNRDSNWNQTSNLDNDYGQLSCWGRNRIGEQIQPCLFNILPTGNSTLPIQYSSYR